MESIQGLSVDHSSRPSTIWFASNIFPEVEDVPVPRDMKASATSPLKAGTHDNSTFEFGNRYFTHSRPYNSQFCDDI
jgi:hypothetical protein